MTENRLTDNEIIKALNECLTEPCGIQSFIYAVRNALDLIKRKDEQIEGLIAGQETLQKALNEKIAEVKMLQTYITNHPYRVVVENADIYTKNHEEYEKLLVKLSTEAVKEFAERFLKKIHAYEYLVTDRINSKDYGMFTVGIEQAVKETEKEMVGETDA